MMKIGIGNLRIIQMLIIQPNNFEIMKNQNGIYVILIENLSIHNLL